MIIKMKSIFIGSWTDNKKEIVFSISIILTLASLMTISSVYGQNNKLSGVKNFTNLLLPQISPIGSNIFLVWQDNTRGNEEILLRKSTNGGITFGNTTNISNDTGFSASPQIDTVGNSIYVVWQDNSTGNEEIFTRKSTDGGITFGNTTNISNDTGFSASPQIDTVGNSIYVVWQDNSTGNEEIFTRKSTDGGITFGNTTNISNDTGFSASPQIDTVGNSIYVVWQDNSTGNEEIFLKKSTDGAKFSSKKNLSNDTGFSSSPQIETFGTSRYVVWQDNSTGNEEIFFRGSMDGAKFSSKKNLSNDTGFSASPQINTVGNTTYVVWQDNSTGNEEIFTRKSTDGGITFGNTTNISNDTGFSASPQVEASGNTTYVVWQDNSTGNEEIFIRKSAIGESVFYDLKDIRGLNLEYKGGPVVSDPNLKVQQVTTGIDFPTSMAFLGTNDILALEKNEGKVIRIVNGSIISKPLLDANVANSQERGMLGVAISKQISKENAKQVVYVFLYYTESKYTDGEDKKGQVPLGNRLYRYELAGDKLINPKLLLDLPRLPDTVHNGGKILVGPDNNVYLTIGDLTRDNKNDSTIITKAQNHENGLEADGRAGIMRVTQTGNAVDGGILGGNYPLDRYFAYGIRNSFGIAFDPVTGKLWDTESGPEFGDEINLVNPGFNSGWNKVQGIWETNENYPGNVTTNPTNLYYYKNGHYSPPKFTWFDTSTGPTAITFLNSSKLGKQYLNNMFVGGFHDGNVYRFRLDQNRTGLSLVHPLEDKVSNNRNEIQTILFAKGFGGITDMKVGPDGYLYVLSLFAGGDDCGPIYQPGNLCISYTNPLNGAIFRIMPK